MEDQDQPHRAKRSLNSDYYSQFEIQGEYDDVGIEDLTTPAYQDADQQQSVLSSSLNGHKIRNIKNKIRKLGLDSQVNSLSTFEKHLNKSLSVSPGSFESLLQEERDCDLHEVLRPPE